MSATPSAGAPGNETGNVLRRGAALLALTSLLLSAQAPAQSETAAVLKLQEVDFLYRSSVAPLSCSALQNRVASILRALGARQDVEVSVTSCDLVVDPLDDPANAWRIPSDPGQTSSDRWRTSSDRWGSSTSRIRDRGARREQSAHVRIRLMMPVEATPEILAELERDKARRDLVSRVTGNPAASLNDPIVFPAQRQLVTLSHRTVDLAPEDCELLEQMSSGVFRRLGIRVVRRSSSCDRDQLSRIPPKVTVEALMPVMPRAPQVKPAPAEADPDPGAPEAEPSEPAASPPE